VSRQRTGTLAWARATGGALDRRARFEQLRHAVLARLAALGPERRRRAGLPDGIELPEREPDSSLCRDALDLCRETSSAALVGHCLRTWLFATLFAGRDDVAHDDEVLYIACLLHDLGLTPGHWQRDKRARCFAVEGAFAAERFCLERGEASGRAAQIAEAIVCHLNVRVPLECGPETRLLHAGVGLDAVGRRAGEFGSDSVDAVLARHPRVGLADELCELTARQAKVRPESRIGLLTRLGFRGLVRGNPLDR
jgi:hypothetical protein